MRLLQLATGPEELIDLHPHITVLNGLTDEQRDALAAAVAGLATGTATGTTGLVEAHGVLFDLTPELLRQIEPTGEDVTPVVRAADLPMSRVSATARRDLTTAERALAVLIERAAVAHQAHTRAVAAFDAADEALVRAQGMVDDHDASVEERLAAVGRATGAADQAVERTRRAEEAVDRLRPQLEEATARRSQIEAETMDVRRRHQDTLARSQRATAALEEARGALDPDAVVMLAAAEDTLEGVRAAVARERAALEGTEGGIAADDRPSLAELETRQGEVQERLDAMTKGRAAFAPASRDAVAEQLERVRGIDGAEQVASPVACALADTIDAVDAELAALSPEDDGRASITDVKARLDDARQDHLEAEQAVRNPELDRSLVNRLEEVHADLLDVMDKVDTRFGGARAQRKADELRGQEQGILDQLGFTSYSDYMMGNSLLHVDPEKEARLEDARTALAAVEDEWGRLQSLTDTELSRAEVRERRRLLVDDARALLGRPAGAATIAADLREHRVEGITKLEAARNLQAVLAEGGLELGDEALPLEEVVLVAEAWIDEVDQVARRQDAFEEDYRRLEAERSSLAAAVAEARDRELVAPAVDPEIDWAARLDGAGRAVDAATARTRAQDAAAASLVALEAELAAATDDERQAGAAAADAEAAVAAAIAVEAPLADAVRAAQAELVEGREAEAAGQQARRALEAAGPGADIATLTATLTQAQADRAAADAVRRDADAGRVEIDEQRMAAEVVVAEARAVAGAAPDDVSVAEEVEWYLLARLAAQRSVSLAGSTPLLLDDALRGLTDDDLQHVLDRLERMAEAVQVIVVSEDPKVGGWALLAGPDRAAVVRPGPVRSA